MIEVDRHNRQDRRRQGKSDPIDAVQAAHAALSGHAEGRAKSRDGAVEAIRVLVVAKHFGARQARVKALSQMRQLTFTAPDQLQCRIKGRPTPQFLAAAKRLRPTGSTDPVTTATKAALSSLAHRIDALDEEVTQLDARITPLLEAHTPNLLNVYGVGIDTTATLLVTAGDNPERLRSEAAWAHLCGVSPLQASSGKVTRHRLNRGGDRQANRALWIIVISSTGLRSRDPGLHGAPNEGGSLQPRDHPHAEALRRPRGLSPPTFAAEFPGPGPGSHNACRRSRLAFNRFAGSWFGPSVRCLFLRNPLKRA